MRSNPVYIYRRNGERVGTGDYSQALAWLASLVEGDYSCALFSGFASITIGSQVFTATRL